MPEPSVIANSMKIEKYRVNNKDFLKNHNENYILIGMPNVNPATEIIMAEIFGEKPFSRGKSKQGYIINDRRRPAESVFYEKDEGKSPGIYYIGKNKTLAKYKIFEETCGIIIKTQWNGKNIIILAGYDGPATEGAAKLTTKSKNEVNFINEKVKDGKWDFIFTCQCKAEERYIKPPRPALSNGPTIIRNNRLTA